MLYYWHLPTPEVGFRSWIISEITKDLAKELTKWQSDNELPFDSLFPKDSFVPKQGLSNQSWTAEKYPVTRTVIPFKADPYALSILDKLKESHVDYKTGILTKDNRQVRLGKYVLNKKSPFTEEERNWWVHSGHPLEDLQIAAHNNEYAIVVSRNPIDIVRMSNHDGWTSCHAQGREYFQCAISDAKGAGAIAYVVKKEDLDKVNLQTPEIFTDKQRGVDGISPISRLRLRKFTHKEDDYDLAVPEDRVYGKKFPGLEDSVRDWALENQKELFQGKRPRMKDFQLMGGSYQDSQAGDLFNNMFGDDLDSGDADYGGEDEHQNMIDQMETEVDLIERQYRNKFKHCSFYAEVEESDGHPYVSYSGSVHFEIPDHLMLNGPKTLGDKEAPDYWQKQRKIEDAIQGWAKDNDIYGVDNVSIDGGSIYLDIRDDADGMDPDSFRSFLANELTEYDGKVEELTGSLYHLLTDLGLAQSNMVQHVARNWDEHPYQFQNFIWEGEEPAVMVSLKEPIILTTQAPETTAGYLHQYEYHTDKFKEAIMQELNAWADRIHSQPNLFKGTEWEPRRAFKSEFAIKPEIEIKPAKNPWQKPGPNDPMAMYMTISFEPFAKDEDFHDVIDFVRFLDNNYAGFAKIANRLYAQAVTSFTANKQIVTPQVQPNG